MTTLPQPFNCGDFGGEAGASQEKPVREKKSAVTFERIVTVGAILLAVGGAFTTLSGHERRITNMEERERANRDTLLEMKGDIKVLIERTKPNQKS